MASIFKVVRNDCVPSELATPTEQELENAAIHHGIPRQHLGMYVSFVLPKCKQTEEYKSFAILIMILLVYQCAHYHQFRGNPKKHSRQHSNR